MYTYFDFVPVTVAITVKVEQCTNGDGMSSRTILPITISTVLTLTVTVAVSEYVSSPLTFQFSRMEQQMQKENTNAK